MDIRRQKRSRSEIPVLPMVNVIFLLLVFFLVSGTIEKVEIVPVEPPMAESGKVLDEGHIVIVMGQYDELLLNDEMVMEDEIVALLNQQLKEHPEKIITIKADMHLSAHKLIQMMDYVRAAGGQNLSLVTQSPV